MFWITKVAPWKKDIVDMLWTELKNSELAMFVTSIKVDYLGNPQKYTEILQEITTQTPTSKTPLFKTAGISELKTGGITAINQSALQK